MRTRVCVYIYNEYGSMVSLLNMVSEGDAEAKAEVGAERSAELSDLTVSAVNESSKASMQTYEPWEAMDEDQRKGCVILSSRGVSDVGVCESLGITGDMLISFRATDNYREEIAKQSGALVKRELNADEKWGSVENLALQNVEEQIRLTGHSMELSELLQAARTANAAKRKHGRLSEVGNKATQDANGNIINVSNVTQINVPSIFLDNLQKTVEGNVEVLSESKLTEQYAGFSNQNMNAGKVGDLLNVDLNKKQSKSANVLNNENTMMGVFEKEDFNNLIDDEVI